MIWAHCCCASRFPLQPGRERHCTLRFPVPGSRTESTAYQLPLPRSVPSFFPLPLFLNTKVPSGAIPFVQFGLPEEIGACFVVRGCSNEVWALFPLLGVKPSPF